MDNQNLINLHTSHAKTMKEKSFSVKCEEGAMTVIQHSELNHTLSPLFIALYNRIDELEKRVQQVSIGLHYDDL